MVYFDSYGCIGTPSSSGVLSDLTKVLSCSSSCIHVGRILEGESRETNSVFLWETSICD